MGMVGARIRERTRKARLLLGSLALPGTSQVVHHEEDATDPTHPHSNLFPEKLLLKDRDEFGEFIRSGLALPESGHNKDVGSVRCR